MKPKTLKTPSSGHESKEVKRKSSQRCEGSQKAAFQLWFLSGMSALACFKQEEQQETYFMLLSSRDSTAAGPETVKRYLPWSHSWTREENVLPFNASLRSVCTLFCITWRIGSLFRQPPGWSRIAMAITLMVDKCWIDIAKGSAWVRGKIHAFFHSCHKKSQFIVTGYFLNLRNMVAKSLILC